MSDEHLSELPIFPLVTVLFPDGLLPLRIFETRYMDMARECLKRKVPFGVCRIVEGKEVGAPATPEPVGTLAQMFECDMPQLGVLLVKTRGGQRLRIKERKVRANGLIVACTELLEDEEDEPLPERFRPCAAILERIVQEQPAAVFLEPHRFESARWVGHRLSEILPIPGAAKQKLLELDHVVTRLEILYRYLDQRGLLAGK